MDTTMRRSSVEQTLQTGLRNLWHPIAASWMIRSAPVGLQRLGERMAVWRDEQGRVHAVNDRCPHRGARLSQGWNLGSRLACWYHGVEVGGDGVVAKVPALADCYLEGRKLNHSFPVIERAGAVFAWFGTDETKPLPPGLPEEIEPGPWAQILCTAQWRCNYHYAMENVMDPMHGVYLHAASHSMAGGAKSAVMRARDTDAGFIFEKTDQAGVNFDWAEFGDTGFHWLRLEIPYGNTAGPGGPFRIVGAVTPVDEHNCRVFFWRCRRVEGWQRDAWKFLYRARLEGLHWDVLEQDRLVLENMAQDARDHETLYAHDAGISRLRRMMRQKAEAELQSRELHVEVAQ